MISQATAGTRDVRAGTTTIPELTSENSLKRRLPAAAWPHFGPLAAAFPQAGFNERRLGPALPARRAGRAGHALGFGGPRGQRDVAQLG